MVAERDCSQEGLRQQVELSNAACDGGVMIGMHYEAMQKRCANTFIQ